MAGANMSGDLKNPGKSIPNGTLFAIAVSSAVYCLFCFAIALTVEHETLNTKIGYRIFQVCMCVCIRVCMHIIVFFLLIHTRTYTTQNVAFAPFIVTIGIFLAVLSSAMASIIGGARYVCVCVCVCVWINNNDILLFFLWILVCVCVCACVCVCVCTEYCKLLPEIMCSTFSEYSQRVRPKQTSLVVVCYSPLR